MTKSGDIRIKILQYDDGDGIFYLDISCSNGLFSSSIQDYFNLQPFASFGQRIETFPQNPKESVAFEHGNTSERSRTYLSLIASIYDHRGYAMIQVTASNNGGAQIIASAQYSIKSEIASINQFGRDLVTWTKSPDKLFVHNFFCDF